MQSDKSLQLPLPGPEKSWESECSSKQTTPLVSHGPTLTEVLEQAWRGGFATKSNFARSHADPIAQAACLGLITTQHSGDTFGRIWRITPAGLERLWKTLELTHEQDL